jgi:hypothetical protein
VGPGCHCDSRYTCACTQCGEDLQKNDFLRDPGISELIHNCERQHPIALEMHHDFQHALGEYLKDVKVRVDALENLRLVPREIHQQATESQSLWWNKKINEPDSRGLIPRSRKGFLDLDPRFAKEA